MTPNLSTQFCTADGKHYLCADRGLANTKIVADRTAAGEWETFEIEDRGEGHVALRASNGKYVCAEGGGGRELVANREHVGAWETFTLGVSGDGVTLQTFNGMFVCAEGGGGTRVVANRPTAGPWETFTSTTPLGTAAGGGRTPTGRVRADRHVFVDDGGPFFAIGTTLFWAIWGWMHDRERVVRNLDYCAQYGLDYIRILSMVGGGGWDDRAINPDEPGYWTACEELLDACTARRMRAEVTLFAAADQIMPSPAARQAHADRWASLLRGREAQVLFVEVANEYWQNGFDDNASEIRSLAKRFRQATGLLVGTSAPHVIGEAFQESYARPYLDGAADVGTPHFERASGGDGAYRAIRQPWEYQFEGTPALYVNNEPKGPQSSGEEEADPGRLALSAITTAICKGAGYCLHTGAGVRGGGAADLARGRASNLYESPNMDAIMTALQNVRALIPPDLANWQAVNWQPERNPPLRYAGGNYDKDIVRSFAAVNGDRFIWVPMGTGQAGRGNLARFTATRPMALKFYDPATSMLLEEQTLAAGAEVPIRRDYIVVAG